MGRGSSAPLKLRRLFLLLLFLTFALNAGSLLALMRTQRMTLDLDRGIQPLLYKTEEFVSTLRRVRLDLYRHLSDYTTAREVQDSVARMTAEWKELERMQMEVGTAVPARDYQQLGEQVMRLGKLCELVLSARASERWNDLSLLQRQIEDNASQTVSAAQAMREKLQVLVARESDRLRAFLAAMRIVFLASLAASLFIALGMWFVWKRFEESILGI